MKTDILVVGAGFAGSVVAERLASAGRSVLVMDRRTHIGGNAFDEEDSRGLLIHRYGPHIFHTNSKEVFDYLSRFTEWRPYEHRVLSFVEGKLLPIPINLDTVNRLYNLDLDEEGLKAYFEKVRDPRPEIRTSEDVIVNTVGWDLYKMFYRGYTRKQWGLDPSELFASVASRVPVRTNQDDRYFTDTYQAMPKEGYTPMFERILDHPKITLALGEDYLPQRKRIEARHIVYTGPIDEYFDCCYGKLPYRSLSFEHEQLPGVAKFQPVGTVNYPNDNAYTRITEFKHLTGQIHPDTAIVREYPQVSGDPYYPIPRPENDLLYKKYRALSEKEKGVSFVGRLAQYRYYNMDQVVGAALSAAKGIRGEAMLMKFEGVEKPDQEVSNGEQMRNYFNFESLPEEEEITRLYRSVKVLSTLPYGKSIFWKSCIEMLDVKPIHNLGRKGAIGNNIIRIFKLFGKFSRGKYDAIILSGVEKSDLIYLIFTRICFWKNIPHVLNGSEWSIPRSKFKKFLYKTYFKFVDNLVVQIQSYSPEEVEIYQNQLGIPKNKFKIIPSSTTVIGYNFIPEKGNFLLTGGSSFRDYSTLLEKAEKFPIPLEVGLPKGSNLIAKDAYKNCDNISIHYGLPRTDFMKKTSQCRMFLLPIAPGMKRIVGDQSILNAMYFGKIVIATDSIGPRNYIIHGVNGFLVPESDSQAWIERIYDVLKLKTEEYEKIVTNGIYTAKEIFSENNRLKKILKETYTLLDHRLFRI